ncbi:S-adenosyl-L-methionine-dependent methyltransferase [Aaosphaeria arxii CBS 175.79]|uniref:S-adenosyl-L-methionine-dependent methyltransferase n=1 Tax=Aaosphaeria arxii CBS 175.79 TaxID=1450172 RepID=A0A6A5Y5X4_9PLEO|nr:S-adenosyl-L-methionine-dependent methyltransferase [Aaosphaeria arxii CBS 175.79]KAF2019954.1 S-adenosyl-L-methionine-dependent methyltransferase [Aaosphaeria arxii CBS 175.79]
MASNTAPAKFHIDYNDSTVQNFELRNVTTCLQYLFSTLQALPPDFTLLDIGCGPGSITFDLARRFPRAKIIGLDQDATIIERNNSKVDTLAPGSLLEFRTGDILRPETFLKPGDAKHFDVVHEHTTLICIPENAPVLRQMHLLANPNGGIVACRDGDTHSQVVFPACPETAELQERIYQMNGLDTQTGRRLVAKALEAGFRRDQIVASASVLSNITERERKAYAGSMLNILADESSEYRRAAVKFGYPDERVEKMREEMRKFIDADDAWRLLICTEIICTLDKSAP